MLASCQPILVLALAPALLGQVVHRMHVLGTLLGTFGIALLVLRSSDHLDLIGMLAALGAAAFGPGPHLTRRWHPPVGVWTLTAWQLTAGGLLLVPISLWTEGLPQKPSTPWKASPGS